MRIVCTGDFSASGVFFDQVQAGKEILDDEIRFLFNNADIRHINLENPITDAPPREKGYGGANLKAPLNTARYLKERHIDICTLANNHIMDSGLPGVEETIRHLEESGIRFYGVGGYPEYLIASHGGTKVAFIASSHREGPLWDGRMTAPYSFDIKKIRALIREVKETEDPVAVIYNYHGGTEYNIVPEPKRRAFFHEIARAGADLVIGHHAHAPQGIETIGGRTIVYGLGNFCFDVPTHHNISHTCDSYCLGVDIADDGEVALSRYYYHIDLEKKMIILTKNEEREEFFQRHLQVFGSEEHYRREWYRDAFRVYCTNRFPNVSRTPAPVGGASGPIEKHAFFRKMQERGLGNVPAAAIRTVVSDLRHESLRPFFFGAIRHLLRERAGHTR
ncbi:CapA family protein [uncultured Methanofollis sp.]|uniref:CapA family protein n=1 Tax=uncultured Methanofollis sp. TaxID=262500 RepID=UPI0026166534|nr:CapA family protein [uncultured Methanofollis sp.]